MNGDVTGRPLRVIIIDDAGAVRRATQWMLEYYGHTVFIAETGDLGLQLFDEIAQEIDLVITDIRLPDMSAAAVVQALRQRKPGIRILLISAYDRDQLDPSLAGYEFVQKPLQFSDIGEIVTRVAH